MQVGCRVVGKRVGGWVVVVVQSRRLWSLLRGHCVQIGDGVHASGGMLPLLTWPEASPHSPACKGSHELCPLVLQLLLLLLLLPMLLLHCVWRSVWLGALGVASIPGYK